MNTLRDSNSLNFDHSVGDLQAPCRVARPPLSHSAKARAALGAVGVVGMVAALGITAAPAYAGATVQGWQAFSAVESMDPDFGRSTTYDYDTGFGGDPISRSLTVSRGGGVSHTNIRFDSGGVASSWGHTMAPGHDDAEPRTAYIYEFKMEHDATYSISGFYNAVGTTRMSAIIDLWERGPGTRLFRQQIDGTTTNPSMTLGTAPTWPWYSTVVGAQTGTLLAGHLYRLDVDVFLRQGMNGLPVQGTGEVNLVISPIPAPSAAALGLGAVLAGARRRRVP